jgi:hypothetical protein
MDATLLVPATDSGIIPAVMRTRVSLLALIVVFAIVLVAAVGWLTRDAARGRLFDLTGESEPLPQVRGLFQFLSNYTRPAPKTEDFAAVAHAGVNPFGANTFLQQEVEPAKRERQMQMLQEAGFKWIRQEFTWEDIEIHGKGDFEDRRNDPPRSAWEKYDHIVDLAEEYDINIIARLSNPPAWTRALTDTIGTRAPPDDVRDYGDFVETVVDRYQGRIHYYQLWNEPNIYPEWGEQPVDPRGYAELLCEGYRRAKAVDPNVVILSGALAQTIDLSGRDLNDFVFLQRLYDAGAGDCFDIMTTNTYLLWSAPTDHRMRPLVTNYGRTEYIRDIMVRNGDANKPIWISEMNSNAVPVGPQADDVIGWGAYGQVSLDTQAAWAPLAYERAQAEWPYVGVVNFWFFKPASDADANQAYYYFRMVEPDFTPLPVYNAVKAYANQAPFLYPGTHQENHWVVNWEGEWFERVDEAALLGGYRLAGQNASARICVEGGDLNVVRAPASDEGADITVDRGDDGCLTVYAEPGVAIDAFVVGGESNPPWAMALVAVAVILLIGWAFWRWRRRASLMVI